ncbi:TetR/AcrR family transcriptional regulator [Pseudoprimorskyibacter insulae]|nr:TetR/AcrR family transcriptional regulator [Pseudoprimorskyibacter insulae]
MQKGILDAALKVFVKSGFQAATIAEIAKEAGLGKGTLYLYFKNKDALVDALLERHLKAARKSVTEYLEPESLDDFLEGLARMMDLNEAQAGFIRVYFEVFGPNFSSAEFSDRVGAVFDELAQVYTKSLTDLRAKGEIRGDIDIADTARSIVSMIDGMMLHRGLQLYPAPRQAPLSAAAIKVLRQGLKPS